MSRMKSLMKSLKKDIEELTRKMEKPGLVELKL